MKLKRLVASISASFDDLVSKIENHEAVAEVTLQEIRAAAAKIRTQLNLTRQRVENLQNQYNDLARECELWQSRALQSNAQDKERALRCIQALELGEQRKSYIGQQIQDQLRLQKELTQHLSNVEQRLTDLQLKRDSLAARAARNQATRYLENALPGFDSDKIFSRWEEKVLADEYGTFSVDNENPKVELDAEFRRIETQNHLEARLAQLLKGQDVNIEGDVK